MLFTNSFSENEITRFVNETASFVKDQREKYVSEAAPLSEQDREAFKPFFSEAILNTTLFFRKSDGRIESPDFVKELNERGVLFSLDRMEAVTFVDVVVSYGGLATNVKFHELVHAVQYQKMGLKQFANKYFRGLLLRGSYEKIPLEVNARLLEESFIKDPAKPFSVEADVQRWINENKF